MKSLDMPSSIILNRVNDTVRIEGFDDDNCHVGTGYVKANRAMFDIAYERERQISKGYDAAHDDADKVGNHARAAAYYATAAQFQRNMGSDLFLPFKTMEDKRQVVDRLTEKDSIGYPWDPKTKNVEYSARANLVKAAALIVAEIERIDREGDQE